MPEYIRALIVILGLSFPVFYFAKTSVVGSCMTLEEFNRRRNLWVGITLVAFLSQNYWIFLALTIWLVSWAAKKDENRVALFFFICLALPQIKVEIPGAGGIRYLISIDYLRTITLVLLLPVCLAERKNALKNKSKITTPDVFLGLYLVYLYILDMQYNSLTGNIRLALEFLIDIVIPYYAISRYVKKHEQFKGVLASFCIAALLAAAVGIFEFFRSWILYSSAGDALGVDWNPGYLARGEYIRALGTSGQAIVFGYVMAIAMALYFSLSAEIPNRKNYLLGCFVLLGGIVAPLSKGPWVGLSVAAFFLLLTSQEWKKNTAKAILLAIPVIAYLVLTDSGAKVTSYLPFFGDLDEGSFTYREQLFNKSIAIIFDNPLFGSIDYRSEMEELRTGVGIVDLVNTFLVIALRSGLIGLFLFLGFYLSIGKLLLEGDKKLPFRTRHALIARSLFAANIAILVIIATVSPIYHVPFFMWVVPALSLAYWRMLSKSARH